MEGTISHSEAVDTRSIMSSTGGSDDDDKILEQIGYVSSFRREFSNLATVRMSAITIHDVLLIQMNAFLSSMLFS